VDWHGSLEQYRHDKLSLTRAAGEHVTLVADNITLHEHEAQIGGALRYVASDATSLSASLGLIGEHNNSNVALALAAVSALTGVSVEATRVAVERRASDFTPLRGRLTFVASEGAGARTIRYIDDGLATSVLPTLAALEVFVDTPLVLIAGGFDRGVDYGELADALVARSSPVTLVTMGNAGARLSDEVRQRRPGLIQHVASTMREAVEVARTSLDEGGVILLSPAAPSFDRYHNWEERSADFAAIVHSLVS
jgi:UDP-N-acetylmuramoylalanine--D-glutamate ligase